MFKYFIAFLSSLLISFFLISQNIQFLNTQNLPINYGDTITVYGSAQSSELIAYVKVKNITSSTIEVVSRKWVISTTSGTQNVFCWASLCYPPNVSESQPMNIAPNATVNDFSGHFFPNGISSEALIMYTFDVRNGDSAWIYIKYDATGQNIALNPLSKLHKPYPNPASKEVFISYSIPIGKLGIVEVFDIIGKKQLAFNVKSNNNLLSVPVSNLKNGIYFIQLTVDSKIVGIEKFIVNK